MFDGEFVVNIMYANGYRVMVGKVLDTGLEEYGRAFYHATVANPGSQTHQRTSAPCGIDIQTVRLLRDIGVDWIHHEPWGRPGPFLVAEVRLFLPGGKAVPQWWPSYLGANRLFLPFEDWMWEPQMPYQDHWVDREITLNV